MHTTFCTKTSGTKGNIWSKPTCTKESVKQWVSWPNLFPPMVRRLLGKQLKPPPILLGHERCLVYPNNNIISYLHKSKLSEKVYHVTKNWEWKCICSTTSITIVDYRFTMVSIIEDVWLPRMMYLFILWPCYVILNTNINMVLWPFIHMLLKIDNTQLKVSRQTFQNMPWGSELLALEWVANCC